MCDYCGFFIKKDNDIYLNTCMLYKWQYSKDKVYENYYPYLERAVCAVKDKWGTELKNCNLFIDDSDMEYQRVDTVNAITDKILELFLDPSFKFNKIFTIGCDRTNEVVVNRVLGKNNINPVNDTAILIKIKNIIEGYKEFLLKKYAIKNIGENIYLESANVFANEYVLIKNLFLEPYVIKFFIYHLYLSIHKFMNEKDLCNKGIILISASDTGAMIINSLMILFNDITLSGQNCAVSGQHLLHIGPKFNYSMNGLSLSALEGNKYIYIYDFMCEGSEYNLMKNCLEMSKAMLVGAIGIAKFNYPRHFDCTIDNTKPIKVKTDIKFLIDLEKWSNDDTNKYRINYEGQTA